MKRAPLAPFKASLSVQSFSMSFTDDGVVTELHAYGQTVVQANGRTLVTIEEHHEVQRAAEPVVAPAPVAPALPAPQRRRAPR